MKKVTPRSVVPNLSYGEVAKLSPEEKNSRTNKQKNDWQRRNPVKARAKVYAQRYTKLKNACEWCGATEGLGRHHPDYSKTLEVLTLCKKCHKKADAERRKLVRSFLCSWNCQVSSRSH